MRPLLDDQAAVHDDDQVGVDDGRQPVGDDERRPAARAGWPAPPGSAPRRRCRAQLVASSRTTSAGSLQQRAGDRQPLPLALAELVAPLADDRGVALGQGRGELVDQRGRARRPRPRASVGLGVAVADVVGQALAEDDRVLEDDADLAGGGRPGRARRSGMPSRRISPQVGS